MKFLHLSIFVGHFCPPGSESALSIQIQIQLIKTKADPDPQHCFPQLIKIKADPDPQHCFPRCEFSFLFLDQDENMEPSAEPQKGEKRGLKKPTPIIKGRDILSSLTNK
jgi:hypothetical protein